MTWKSRGATTGTIAIPLLATLPTGLVALPMLLFYRRAKGDRNVTAMNVAFLSIGFVLAILNASSYRGD